MVSAEVIRKLDIFVKPFLAEGRDWCSSLLDDSTIAVAVGVTLEAWARIGFDCSRGEEFVKGATGPVKQPLIYIHVLPRPEGPQGEAKIRAQKAKKP